MFLESRNEVSTQWTASKLHVPRDYKLYDALAGGRNFTASLHLPKGLPADVSDTVLKLACFRVAEIEEELKQSKWPEFVVLKRSSMAPPSGEIIRRGGADYYYQWFGYMHSHTWLTRTEIMGSLAHANLDIDQLDQTYRSLLEEMRNLESSGLHARLIIWFDGGPRENYASKASREIGRVLWGLWGILDYTREDLIGKVEHHIGEAIIPVFQILTTSRSSEELTDVLKRTEKEVLNVRCSSKRRLHSVATELLALDVAFPNGLGTTPIFNANNPHGSKV